MLKHIFSIIILLCSSNLFAQRSDSYKNLEKYWYYRYRLVNDFLKIGLNAGQSIPAAYRLNGTNTSGSGYTDGDSNHQGCIGWGADATNNVGNYIMTLATEYKQLSKNGKSTSRTEYELEHAIKAFIRLDEHAELFQNAATRRSYPDRDIYPGYFNGWHPGTNGYFIRDDVPFFTFIIPEGNWHHFNRLGMRHSNSIYTSNKVCSFNEGDGFPHYKTAYEGRYDGIDPRTSARETYLDAPYYYNNPPPITPIQESQDQISSVWPALAFAYKHVYKGSGKGLENPLKEELYKIINHIRDYNWMIKDPITATCVYGIVSHKWPNSCAEAGGDYRGLSIPSTDALRVVTGDIIVPPPMTNYVFQLAKIHGRHLKDIGFYDSYVAFSNSWWPTSFTNIVDHSLHGAFRSPYMPLLYRYHHRRVNANKGVGYYPESWGTVPVGSCSYTIPSYEQLLDVAPPCGPYNYESKSPNRSWNSEWSTENRVQDPFKRDACYGEPPESGDRDFNGLDYMYLFNLYSLVTGDKYLKKMNNPYFDDNFTKQIPYSDPTHGWIGDNTKKLKLNYLQYLGLKNIITSTGNVTFRGAQTVELLPGFSASLGSNTLVYVQDYQCAGGHNQEENERFTHAYLSQPIEQTIQGGESEEFVPIEFGEENIDGLVDSFDYADTVANGYFPYYDTSYINSLIDSVLITGDSDLIRIMYNLIDTTDYYGYKNGNNSDTTNIEQLSSYYKNRIIQKSGLPKTLSPTIHPNPTTGKLTITMPEQGDYDIKVVNILGATVYRGQMNRQQKTEIQLDASLPAGNYTVHINGSNVNHVQKIALTR